MRKKQLGDAVTPTHIVVLDTGEEVLEQLNAFAAETGLGTAQFTAIGAFQSVVLGYFDLDEKRYLENPVTEQCEVLTLAGNVVRSGDEYKLHAHVVVGLRDGTTRGGHLLRAHVRPTLEVSVTESPREVQRRFDKDIGLALIDVDG
jgi:predicted DNA-binding protein with PD1-like motif